MLCLLVFLCSAQRNYIPTMVGAFGQSHKTNSILGWDGSALFCSSATDAGECVCL